MDNIAKEIAKALSEYTNDVEEGLREAQKDIATETVKDVKSNAQSQGLELTGDYIKGWAKKKTRNGYVVYNRTDYQLTHLLEKGHAKRGGGRVQAYPHIRPAEQEAIEKYIERMEKVIKG